MAHSLGLEVIAEGLETEGQKDFLHLHGCSLYQGYLFSPALPADNFFALVQSQHH
jgi:sensor c-di-GMP phosphodiesterase-like protein